MSLTGLLGIARDGVLAQSAALSSTGSNVSNVATPGYTRRTAMLESRAEGGGVRFLGARRHFDRFAQQNVVEQYGRRSAATSRANALAQIEAVIAPPTGDLSQRAIALVEAFNALTGFPLEPAVRAEVVGKAAALAHGFAETSSALDASEKELYERAQSVTNEVNERLSRVAELNSKIATMIGLGGDPASLQDQRDLVVQEIGERIGARTVEDSSGRLTLFSAGAVLVEGDRAMALNVDLDPGGKLRFTAQGATSIDLTSRIDTGSLGGIREARDVDLAKTKQGLDAFAFDLAQAFNQIHADGYGLDGGTGRALFTTSATVNGAAAAMALSADIDGHPERIAAASSAGQVPGGNANALRLAELGEKDVIGGASIANRYAAIASDVGTRRLAAENEELLRSDTLAVAESLAQDASGVSLDEEMVDLSRYQRAFEANTRVLRVVDELLQTLINTF